MLVEVSLARLQFKAERDVNVVTSIRTTNYLIKICQTQMDKDVLLLLSNFLREYYKIDLFLLLPVFAIIIVAYYLRLMCEYTSQSDLNCSTASSF